MSNHEYTRQTNLTDCIYDLLQSSPDDEFKVADIRTYCYNEGWRVRRSRISAVLRNLCFAVRREKIYHITHGYYSASPLHLNR